MIISHLIKFKQFVGTARTTKVSGKDYQYFSYSENITMCLVQYWEKLWIWKYLLEIFMKIFIGNIYENIHWITLSNLTNHNPIFPLTQKLRRANKMNFRFGFCIEKFIEYERKRFCFSYAINNNWYKIFF